MIVGRGPERAAIAEVIAHAGDGHAELLLLVGDPGMGKSTLLSDAEERATDFTVLHTNAVESESEFPFAGLHELLLPAAPFLDRIPEVQANALRASLALNAATGSAPLTVGAGVLSMLAAISLERPVLCLIDAAHWLDEASAGALFFACRRLRSERVAVVVASEDSDHIPQDTFPRRMFLAGLDESEAEELLRNVLVTVDPAVAATLSRAVGGNPAALLEAAETLSKSQLAGVEPLPQPLPLRSGVPRRLVTEVQGLSPAARQALLRASMAGTSTYRVISGVGADLEEGIVEAEAAGLVSVAGGQFTFSHRLMPSQVFEIASPEERRAAHRDIARALSSEEHHTELRLWHLAAGAVGPDVDLATDLAAGAESVRSGRGHASAVSLFEAAARLADDSAQIRRWTYDAARSAWLSGQPQRAVRLVERVGSTEADPALNLSVALLTGQLRWSGALVHAKPTNVDVPVIPARGVAWLLLESRQAQGDRALELTREALEIANERAPTIAWAATLADARARDGVTPPGTANSSLEAAAELLWEDVQGSDEVLLEALQCMASWTPAYAPWAGRMLDRLTLLAHRHTVAAVASASLATAHQSFADGRWADATVGYFSARTTALDTGQPMIAARADACIRMLDALRATASDSQTSAPAPLGVESAITAARHMAAGRAESVLESEDAIDWLTVADWLPPASFSPLDLVEARQRAGRDLNDVDKYRACSRLRAADRAWLACVLDTESDTSIPAAIELFGGPSRQTFPIARMLTTLGQRLRRSNRRTESREPLRVAFDTFVRLGASDWAEQVRRELAATGVSVRAVPISGVGELTPQELQVARCVADGATYREAAAQLFLSPKTIEFHLSKIYRKLGISSRRELATRLDDLTEPT